MTVQKIYRILVLFLSIIFLPLFSKAQEQELQTPDSMTVNGDIYYVTDSIDNTTFIAYSKSTEEFATIQTDGISPRIGNRFPDYTDIYVIDNSNGRYLLCQKTDSCSYIYDMKSKQESPTIYNHKNKIYDNLVYMGLRKKEPLFHDYNYELFGLDGFYAQIEASETGLQFGPSNDDKLHFSEGLLDEAQIPLRDIPHGHKLVVDLDYHKEHIQYRIPCSNSSTDDFGRISLSICIPKLNGLKRIKKQVLYWIADCFAASQGVDRIFDVTKNSSEKKLIKNIKNYFIQKNVKSYKQACEQSEGQLDYHHEDFKVFMLYRTEDYVSFYITYHCQTEIKCNYAATFDIRNNRRLTLSDIVSEEGQHKIREILSHAYYDGLGINDFVMPVAISQNCLEFFTGESEPSFEAVNLMEASVLSTESKSFLDHLSQPFIPYSYIRPWLKIHIAPDGHFISDDKSFYFEPIDSDNVEIFPTGFITKKNKSQSASSKELIFEKEVNRGYNRNHAKYILEEFPEMAADIYTKLSEEFHTTSMDAFIIPNLILSKEMYAEKLYKKGKYLAADSLCQSLLKEMPLDTAKTLSTNYAHLLFNKQFFFGEPYQFKTSLNDYSTEEGYNSYIDVLILYSKIKAQLHDTEGEVCYSKLAATHLLKYLGHMIPKISKESREVLWRHYRKWILSDLLTCAIQTNDPNLKRQSYNAQLYGKGLLLNTEIAMIKHIMNSNKEETKKILTDYKHAQEDYEKYRRLGKTKKMNDTTEYLDYLHEKLMQNVSFFNYMKSQHITIDQVASHLLKGETALEFCETIEERDTIYYALTVQYQDTIPSVTRICSIKDLKQTNTDDISNGLLYELVWKPLEPILQKSTTLFFSPSGILQVMAIESAIDMHTNQRLNRRLYVNRLSSTREIVVSRDTIFRQELSGKKYGLLIGGLDYNTCISMPNSDLANDESEISIIRGGAHLNNVGFLPSSKKEVEDLSRLFLTTEAVDSIILLEDGKGTENAFKFYSKLPISLLHIATHGFYLSDKDYDKLNKNDYISLLGKNYRDIEEKGLIRSGLLFSGVNQSLAGKNLSGQDDGIMTAMEISNMDLSSVDLAVLSACQTGTGDISNDGVIGLQRGFKKAGVKSIMMSLWPVDDNATFLFMDIFYKHLIKSKDKTRALEAAQNYLQDHTPYNDAKYWASFIILDGMSKTSIQEDRTTAN